MPPKQATPQAARQVTCHATKEVTLHAALTSDSHVTHINNMTFSQDEGVESSGAKRHIILQECTKTAKYRVAESVPNILTKA